MEAHVFITTFADVPVILLVNSVSIRLIDVLRKKLDSTVVSDVLAHRLSWTVHYHVRVASISIHHRHLCTRVPLKTAILHRQEFQSVIMVSEKLTKERETRGTATVETEIWYLDGAAVLWYQKRRKCSNLREVPNEEQILLFERLTVPGSSLCKSKHFPVIKLVLLSFRFIVIS